MPEHTVTDMARNLRTTVQGFFLTGLSPDGVFEVVQRLTAIVEVSAEQDRAHRQRRTAEELAANDAEQRDIDRRVATDMMRETDPDMRCRPTRVPSAMTLEAERMLWEREPDGQGTNAVIAWIAGRVGR